MMKRERDRAVLRVSRMLDRLESRGCGSEEDRELVLQAIAHARDPEHAEGFVVAVANHDPSVVPVRETLDMQAEARRPVCLRWRPDEWRAKHEQLCNAREARRQTSDYTLRSKWSSRVLGGGDWDSRRVQIVANPERLAREAFRQRLSVRKLVNGLERGTLAVVSVLVGGGRWTVALQPRRKWSNRGFRIHSIQGRAGAEADEETVRAIESILGAPGEGRSGDSWKWAVLGRIAVAVLGSVLARSVALVEPLAPRIPGVLLLGIGVACFAACTMLRHHGSTRGATCLFTIAWLAPSACGLVSVAEPLAIYGANFATARGLASQLMLIPAGYVIAALGWPLLRKLRGIRAVSEEDNREDHVHQRAPST